MVYAISVDHKRYRTIQLQYYYCIIASEQSGVECMCTCEKNQPVETTRTEAFPVLIVHTVLISSATIIQSIHMYLLDIPFWLPNGWVSRGVDDVFSYISCPQKHRHVTIRSESERCCILLSSCSTNGLGHYWHQPRDFIFGGAGS